MTDAYPDAALVSPDWVAERLDRATADDPGLRVVEVDVDTDRYGYEATFTPVETEEESDFATDTERFKVRTRKGFKAIKSEAAIEVEG